MTSLIFVSVYIVSILYQSVSEIKHANSHTKVSNRVRWLQGRGCHKLTGKERKREEAERICCEVKMADVELILEVKS